MKKSCLIILLFLLPIIISLGQEVQWELIQSIPFKGIDLVSVDNQNHIYISSSTGDLFKYNEHGQLLSNFSPNWQGKISHLDASWTFQVFTFSKDLQEFRFLDRLMNPILENRTQNLSSGTVKAISPGNNHVLWVYDESDFSLKKWDLRREILLQEQALNLLISDQQLNVIEIREHQNLLFVLLVNHHLLILDLQANIIADFNQYKLEKLAIWNNYLIFQEDNNLSLLDWKKNTVQKLEIPHNLKGYKFLMMKGKWIAYNESELLILKKPFP